MTSTQFEKILIPLRSKLIRFATWLLGNRDDAMDAVQETMTKLWSIREKLDRYERVEAFAFKVLRNTCLDMRRKTVARIARLEGEVVVGNSTPQSMLEAIESRTLMEKIIAGLPDNQREIMILRGIDQKSTEEISEITGLSKNNVRVLLHRARNKIRETYEMIYQYESRRS